MEERKMSTYVFFAAAAIHQQLAIQLQTATNQNAVDKEGTTEERGRRCRGRRRRSDDSTASWCEHDTAGETPLFFGGAFDEVRRICFCLVVQLFS